MKKLLMLVLLISLVSCKKSDKKPMEETPQQTVQKCKNELQLFTGKYQINNSFKDTIEIIFVSDNCPKDNSNNYLVKGLKKALDNYSNSKFEDRDYEIVSNEIVKNAIGDSLVLILQPNQLVLQSSKLNIPQVTFKKL